MKTFTPKKRSEEQIREEQEAINQKNWMYETGQSINFLLDGLRKVSTFQENLVAKSASDRKEVLIAFENLKDSVDRIQKEVNRRVGDAEKKLFEILDQFNDLKEEVSLHYLSKEDYEEAISKIERTVSANHLHNTLKNDGFYHNLTQLQAKATEDLRLLREELTPKQPEIDPIKSQLDERMAVWKVDFDGLVREIALLKKAVSYDQKKFENVYTLIERLKEGKG